MVILLGDAARFGGFGICDVVVQLRGMLVEPNDRPVRVVLLVIEREYVLQVVDELRVVLGRDYPLLLSVRLQLVF